MGGGLLLVFSGLDGAGKSTQINLLLDSLRDSGREPKYLWSRGGYTPTFNALKTLLRRLLRSGAIPTAGQSPQRSQALAKTRIRRLWLWLAILDLMWMYGVTVRWALWRGQTVVCDRYLCDTLIDFHLNFPQEAIEQWGLWWLLVRVTPKPDAAFMLLVPIEESLRRSDAKGEPFRDSATVLAQRLTQYKAVVQLEHWHVLDGRCAINELADAIWDRVQAAGQPDLSVPM